MQTGVAVGNCCPHYITASASTGRRYDPVNKIALIISAILLPWRLGECAPPAARVAATVDRHVQSEVERGNVPGASVAVVKDGRVILTGGYGVRSIATGDPMTAETIVDLASISKSFTAIAIRQLEASGRLALDQPVILYLPEFGLDRAPAPNRITVRHLLQHNSGLTREADMLVPCCGRSGEFDLRLAVHKLQMARPRSRPGTKFEYANSNYVLLAAIVERVSGVAFREYMHTRVFAELGLSNTNVAAGRAPEPGLADWHAADGHHMPGDPSQLAGWFGSSLVRSNAVDMGRYLAALLLDERGKIAVERWLKAAQTQRYEWGWFVQPGRTGRPWPLVEHGGNLSGVNTSILLAPYARAGVAVLVNSGGSQAKTIAREILAHVLGFAP